MELADLTRDIRKKNVFLEPEELFFCKAGLVQVSKNTAGKTFF